MSNDPSDHGHGGGEPKGSPSFKMHGPDIVVTAIVLVICALLYARTYWFDTVPSSLAQNVQPAMFPRLVLICIAAIALILPFEYYRKLKRGIDLDSDRREFPPRLVWVTGAALIVFVAALPLLGALPALLIIAIAMPLMWGERRWKILVPYVIIFPISVLFLFAEVLRVTFPRGITGGIFY